MNEKKKEFEPVPSLAEREALALLVEELGEAIQVVGKILRHGWDSQNPLTLGAMNREALAGELGDVLAAITIIAQTGRITQLELAQNQAAKLVRVRRWLHHVEIAEMAREVPR